MCLNPETDETNGRSPWVPDITRLELPLGLNARECHKELLRHD